ncbi:MAG: hypothetical protein AB7G23_17290 [Vicinamibacterales bacterium]
MTHDFGEAYVRLVLGVGCHDPDYVDAYYGPAAWRAEVTTAAWGLADLEARAAALAADLDGLSPSPGADDLPALRYAYLRSQLSALRARVSMLQGRRLRFDEESRALYDAVAPTHDEGYFEAALVALGEALPGTGSLPERYEAYRSRFIIPASRLDAVFTAAIGASRERTRAHVALPPNERFTVEYVTDRSWSGYNWYQGDYQSLIQVNTDLPIHVDRAVDLACHEGYPGHHVYNVLLEHHLVRGRGWVEFTVYPLFSPQSLIAEGTANAGIDVAFPRAERLAFEQAVVFPAAGLDPGEAARYYDVLGLMERLSYAGNEAARRYLDGVCDAEQATRWLERYGLYAPARAAQRLRFVDQYRSYVINYNLGKDLVLAHLRAGGGTDADPDRRWRVFADLISSPRVPATLAAPSC